MPQLMSREEALELLRRNLRDEKMVKHCIAVEAIMRSLARRLGEDEELWGLIGLLHDIDYDVVNRDPRLHGLKAIEILEGRLPREALEAIALHNERNGFKSTMETAKRISVALRAADHMAGLIVATTLVMPNKKVEEVKISTLKKKFRSKDFARGVSRERIKGIEELGLSLEEFFKLSLEAVKGVAAELGL